MTDRDAALRDNEALWDAWTRVHEASEFYDLEGFKRGGIRLRPYEIQEVGPVAGKDLLHLQCHFGIDTLSWARLGARVTGADFSEAAIGLARSVAAEIGIPDARFVRAKLDDLPNVLEADFDVVYTSRGVLGWLPDIRRWAEVVAHFVRPGGRFYITEIHPVAQVFENEGVEPGQLLLRYPYWEHADPLSFPVVGSYADPEADVTGHTEYGWDHGLGEIVTALIDAGLRIESLREFPFVDWRLDFLVEADDGTWRLPPEVEGELPLFFSLLATKAPPV
ncbi:MAG TPA: class I SAM-dependent methyltransferase [Candidatus Limnocylindrales bacterium]|nr:class I SAM-dependent methyltransferase [Candidatus Limnocylindrales bacterium]